MIFATSILLKIKIKFMHMANVNVKGETKALKETVSSLLSILLCPISKIPMPTTWAHFLDFFTDGFLLV